MATQRYAFVRGGVVRLSRATDTGEAPTEDQTRAWVFGDAEDAAERDLAEEGAWRPCPDEVGEDWTSQGGIFSPPTMQLVPEVITNAQGQASLRTSFLADGTSRRTAAEKCIRDAVAATRSLSDNHPLKIRADLALIGWEQTNEWKRHGATVAAIAAQLGWSEAEVDILFIAAAKIDL